MKPSSCSSKTCWRSWGSSIAKNEAASISCAAAAGPADVEGAASWRETSARSSGGSASKNSELIVAEGCGAGREDRTSRKCWLRTSSRMSSGRASRKVGSMSVPVMSTWLPWIVIMVRSVDAVGSPCPAGTVLALASVVGPVTGASAGADCAAWVETGAEAGSLAVGVLAAAVVAADADGTARPVASDLARSTRDMSSPIAMSSSL